MRLNNLVKVLGLSAAIAMPIVLTGCDDEPSDPQNDAAVDSAVGDTAGPKLDTNTSETGGKLDTGTTDTGTAETGTAGDAGDAASNG